MLGVCSVPRRAASKQPLYASLKLQAPVYDIFPSTTPVFSYALGSRKLSANEQSFVGAQTEVSFFFFTNSSNYIRRLFL